MKDFYKELNLDRNADTPKIYEELVSLQRTWVQRQINSPEKAAAQLLLINEAVDIFSSDDSRRKYDAELSKKDDMPQQNDGAEQERQEQFKRFFGQVADYMDSQDFDLAKLSIESAMKYYDPQKDQEIIPEYRFYSQVFSVYTCCSDWANVLKYANETIIKCPKNEVRVLIDAHISRCDGYIGLYDRSNNKEHYKSAIDSVRKALSLAEDAGIKDRQIDALIVLADALSISDDPAFLEEATRSAQRAIDLGDATGHAKEILSECKERASYTFQPYQGKNHPSTAVGHDACYIATAVYGSYNCPEVWVLRRFRDYKLKKSVWGRSFIRIYYFLSPKLVNWFGDSDWFKRFWKSKLDKIVQELKDEGFSDREY